MRVFIVRHGRTRFNKERRIQGTLIDASLDDVGARQAAAVAAWLRDFSAAEPPRIVASPLRRAAETAQAIAAAFAAPLGFDDRLREFSWGDFMGRVQAGDVARVTEAMLDRWSAGDVEARPPNGESPREVAARTMAAFVDAVAVWPARASGAAGAAEGAARAAPTGDKGPALIMVGHGRSNKALLAALLAGDVARMEDYPQSNTGVTIIERVEPGGSGGGDAAIAARARGGAGATPRGIDDGARAAGEAGKWRAVRVNALDHWRSAAGAAPSVGDAQRAAHVRDP